MVNSNSANITESDLIQGTVIASQANFYQVRLDSNESLLCTRPTRLKKNRSIGVCWRSRLGEIHGI